MIKALKITFTIFLTAFILLGCSPTSPTQELTVNPPTITAPPTSAPTPTTAPTSAPTRVPPPEITSENAAQLKKYSEYNFYSPNDGSWSPDQKWLAIAASNGLVLYDGTTYEQVKQISTDCISKIAWAPDSKNIATIRCDGRLAIWDIENDHVILNNNKKDAWITSFQYSHSGDRIAASTYEGRLIVWDSETGSEISVLKNDVNEVITSICFLQNDDQILYFSQIRQEINGSWGFFSGAIKSWDLKNSSRTIFEDKTLNTGDFSPDCTEYLSLDSNSGTAKILRIETKKFIKTIFGMDASARFIDNEKFISVSPNQIKIINFTSGDIYKKFSLQGSGFHSMEILTTSPDNYSLLLMPTRKKDWSPWGIQIISLVNGKILKESEREMGSLFQDLEISQDSSLLGLQSRDGSLYLLDIPTLEKRKEIISAGKELNYVDVGNSIFSADGNFLLAGSEETKENLNWIDLKNGTIVKTIKLNNPIQNLQLSPDGKLIAWNINSFGSDQFHLEEVDSGTPIKISPRIEPNWQIGWIDWPTFSPDNKNIAFIFNTASNDPPPTRKAIIWDLEKNKEVARFTSEGAYQISYSPDGKYLIFMNGGRIQIVDTKSNSIYRIIPINSISNNISFDISPNNQIIAISSWGNPVTVIDLKTGKGIVNLDTISQPDVKFTRDGLYLIISGGVVNPTISVWSIQQ